MNTMSSQPMGLLPLFQGLPGEQVEIIRPMLELCEYARDACIFEQGDVAQALYLVIQGEVLVRYKAFDGPMITVSRVGPGGVFGWSSMLGRAAYSSEAICLEDAEIYRINSLMLRSTCSVHPEVGRIILDRLAGIIAERVNSPRLLVLEMLTRAAHMN